MKKSILCILILCLMIFISGCSAFGSGQADELMGQWLCQSYLDKDACVSVLDRIGFDEQEQSIVDTEAMPVVFYASFDDNGNYVLKTDIDRTKDSLKEYYNDCISKLYDAKSDLI